MHTGTTSRRTIRFHRHSSTYLYAEHDAGKGVTLIDVTKVTKPTVLADVAYLSNGGSGSLFAVAGTAALVTEEQGTATLVTAPQTIRIMDFSDPSIQRSLANLQASLQLAGIKAAG